MSRKKNSVHFPNLLLQPGIIKDQFYLALKKQIQHGALSPGSKLPSSRSFASMMSISRNSVLAGIERLIDEGYLYSRQGSGTFIAEIMPDQLIHIPNDSLHISQLAATSGQHSQAPYNQVAHSQAPHSQAFKSQPLDRITQHKHLQDPQINPKIEQLRPIWKKAAAVLGQPQTFAIGIGCTDLFPHQLWGRLLARAWRQFSSHMLAPTVSTSSSSYCSSPSNDPRGVPALRQAIADYVHTTRGLNCTVDQVLITSGTRTIKTRG